jgi:hypothetical protein
MSAAAEKFDLDGVEWKHYHYGPLDDLFQRPCSECDRGLLFAPVSECPRCAGSGYFVQATDPRSGSLQGTATNE